MPRLDSITLRIRTGQRGTHETPNYTINGFTLPFDSTEGSTGPGGSFEATGHPQSFPHSLTLVGPLEGAWDIEGAEIDFFVSGEEPYTVRLGSVTLDDHADLRLWYPRPAVLIDV